MKTEKRLFYCSTARGCGIRAAKSEDHARRLLRGEVGGNEINDVHEASEAEIAWVKSMGGYVPNIDRP